MDKKIVASPISPDQPEAPRLIMRIVGAFFVMGVLAIVAGSFWPVVGPWLIGAGIILVIVGLSLLAPYWHPAEPKEPRDIRKLYGDRDV